MQKLSVRDLLLAAVMIYLVGNSGVRSVFAGDEPAAQSRAAVTNAFTFQGRLNIDGVPANGSYDFEFRLFDAATLGNQVGPMETATETVANGIFTSPLDFGNSAFDGNQRWVEVKARPASTGNFVLVGRQELTATPYAMVALNFVEHDHLGEAWNGGALSGGLEISSGVGTALRGITSAQFLAAIEARHEGSDCSGGTLQSPACYGVYAQALADGAVGVFGLGERAGLVGASEGIGVAGLSDEAIGVRGVSGDSVGVVGESTAGIGVYGFSAKAPAIQGESFNATGAAIVGQLFNDSCDPNFSQEKCAGVFGSTGTIGGAGIVGIGYYGVFGKATVTGGSAVEGNAFPIAANGVVGRTTGVGYNGVAGINTGSSCSTAGTDVNTYCIGVYGSANSGVAGVGVYGIGNRVGIWAKPNGTGAFLTKFAAVLEGDVLTGGVFPLTNGVYDLGHSTGAYRDVYITGSYLDISDARMKVDIAPLSAGLSEVLRLNPVSYRMAQDERGHSEMGLLAQDVAGVLPGIVHEADDGMLSLSYVELIPVLINAIKEQQLRIDALESALTQ